MLPVRRRSRGLTDPFQATTRDLERLFEPWTDIVGEDLTASYPVDIREDDNNIYVDAELPGFNKEEIDVSFENGTLTISAERKEEPEEGKGTQHLRERQYRRVFRSFTIPSHVDAQNIDAQLDKGLLKLKLQKTEEARPRRIEIK